MNRQFGEFSNSDPNNCGACGRVCGGSTPLRRLLRDLQRLLKIRRLLPPMRALGSFRRGNLPRFLVRIRDALSLQWKGNRHDSTF
jgi:hypothetical protein